MILSIFSCVCLLSACLLWENVSPGSLPILKLGGLGFFDDKLYEFIYFEY